MYPDYTAGERIADACIHVIGIALGVTGLVFLLAIAIPSLPAPSTVSLVIYAVAMVAMLSFSAAYHLIPVPSWKNMLRRLDQAAIFLKIAGTYTPFAFVKMGGFAGYGLLSVVWGIALVGAYGKLWLPERHSAVTVALYLGLGWAGLLVVEPLFTSIPLAAGVWLGVGGLLYTIGVVFHVWESLPYQNAIWHAFVLAGTFCHYFAVLQGVALV